jgi:prefoldin subunit 2
MTTPPPPEVVQKFRQLLQQSQSLLQKIAELEMDRNEHKLVEDSLEPLDPQRKAYRLVGEMLVERTVQEVLPSIRTNRTHVRQIREYFSLFFCYVVSHVLLVYN